MILCVPERRRGHRVADGAHVGLAYAERGSYYLQVLFSLRCEWVRATKHASRDPFNFLERRHALAEIVERRAGALAERLRLSFPHLEREIMTLSEDASRHGHYFAQQRLGFFEAL